MIFAGVPVVWAKWEPALTEGVNQIARVESSERRLLDELRGKHLFQFSALLITKERHALQVHNRADNF